MTLNYKDIKTFGVSVAGLKYNATHILKQLKSGEKLTLIREPQNSHDRNAVAVYKDHNRLGYIPREKASELAVLLDTGLIFDAKVNGLGTPEIFPYLSIHVSLDLKSIEKMIDPRLSLSASSIYHIFEENSESKIKALSEYTFKEGDYVIGRPGNSYRELVGLIQSLENYLVTIEWTFEDGTSKSTTYKTENKKDLEMLEAIKETMNSYRKEFYSFNKFDIVKHRLSATHKDFLGYGQIVEKEDSILIEWILSNEITEVELFRKNIFLSKVKTATSDKFDERFVSGKWVGNYDNRVYYEIKNISEERKTLILKSSFQGEYKMSYANYLFQDYEIVDYNRVIREACEDDQRAEDEYEAQLYGYDNFEDM